MSAQLISSGAVHPYGAEPNAYCSVSPLILSLSGAAVLSPFAESWRCAVEYVRYPALENVNGDSLRYHALSDETGTSGICTALPWTKTSSSYGIYRHN
eukprot:g42119.t1